MTFEGLYVLCLICRVSFEESVFLICFGVLSILDERCSRISVLRVIFHFCFRSPLIGFFVLLFSLYLLRICCFLFQSIWILAFNKWKMTNPSVLKWSLKN